MSEKIVELNEEVEIGEDEEVFDMDATPEEEEVVEEVEAKEPELPEKFKDKTLQDVIESYQNLEREYGRRNNEIGELRKLTDQLLNLQSQELDKGKDKEEDPLDVDALLENPSSAIEKALENNPKLKAIESKFVEQQREAEKKAFESQHPDWMDVVGSEGFQKWITESPIRTKMFQEADQNYDYSTGAELISLYKQLTQDNTEKASEKQETQRKKDMKKVATEKGGGNASSKKVYRRADLINMRIRDPKRYEAMEDEILAAYAEGRVR